MEVDEPLLMVVVTMLPPEPNAPLARSFPSVMYESAVAAGNQPGRKRLEGGDTSSQRNRGERSPCSVLRECSVGLLLMRRHVSAVQQRAEATSTVSGLPCHHARRCRKPQTAPLTMIGVKSVTTKKDNVAVAILPLLSVTYTTRLPGRSGRKLYSRRRVGNTSEALTKEAGGPSAQIAGAQPQF